MNGKLAINGGTKSTEENPFGSIFNWPIYTEEDEQAVLEVLRARSMSGTDITKKFEQEYKDWIGAEFALGYPNGTAAIAAALWACGVGAGDEVICPSMTYWASCTAALSLGASVHFADIDPMTLCIDPKDIEHRIGPKTKVIIVVHYAGYPADMDAIMEIAERHNVKVLEDASHSHGSMYKGRFTGAIGDIAGMSMMTGKAFAIGEAGMVTTNNRELWERCISYGHYERTGSFSNYNPIDSCVTNPELLKFSGIPLGGRKDRMNQWNSAVGRVQLKHYPERMAEIEKGMTLFSDIIDSLPGLHMHRPAQDSGLTKGGWYYPVCLYDEKAIGVPIEKFCKAIHAEGFGYCNPGANSPLHTHPVFHEADIFNMGKPTMISFGQRDVRQGPGTLPISENLVKRCFNVRKITQFDEPAIRAWAAMFEKVVNNIGELK